MRKLLCLIPLGALMALALAYGQPLTLNDPAFFPRASGIPVSTAKLQQTSNNGGDGAFNDVASRAWGAVIVTNLTPFTLTRLDMKLGNFSGASGTGSITCMVYAASTTAPVGSPLATATNVIANSSLSNTGYPGGSTDVTFYFTGLALSATNYAWVLHNSPSPATAAIFTVRKFSIVGPYSICSSNGSAWGSFTFTGLQWYYVAWGY